MCAPGWAGGGGHALSSRGPTPRCYCCYCFCRCLQLFELLLTLAGLPRFAKQVRWVGACCGCKVVAGRSVLVGGAAEGQAPKR